MKRLIYLGLIGLFLVTACSKKDTKDQTLFDEAQKQMKEENYPMAMVKYLSIVKDYPKGDYYAKSLMELGNIYNAKLITTMSPAENEHMAIYYYKKVFNEFPVSTHAEQALFLTGFIYANELKDQDSAKINYNLFLEKYPNSQLASSVKGELQNIGKTPDDVIDKK